MLIVSTGLVAKLQDARDVVRFYLLHEFAHLQQADLELLTATQALHRAWLAITAVARVASGVLVAPALADPLSRGLLTFVSMLWIATLVVVAIALGRYASVVVAFRELMRTSGRWRGGRKWARLSRRCSARQRDALVDTLSGHC